jgi:hypothetical protein
MIGDHDAGLAGEALEALDAKRDPGGSQNQARSGAGNAAPVLGSEYE